MPLLPRPLSLPCTLTLPALCLLLALLPGAPKPLRADPMTEPHPQTPKLFAQDNLMAWCIVPFDSLERSPEERIAMLQRLGIRQYAWDWRQRHIDELPREIELAQKNDIRLRAVWLWIDANADSVGALGQANRRVMDAVEEAGIAVEFWLGFHENVFEGLSDEERVERGAALVGFLAEEAKRSGSALALYNHGGWFGQSENQIAIIERVGDPSVGMVYNFHHAHHEIDRFAENLAQMLPYLKAVSVNGMNPDGPKILPVGEGSAERAMLHQLRDSGYDGPVALLGHVEDRDVETVLQENLAGLRSLVSDPDF